MTEDIKNKLKSVIDTSGVIGSDIADYIIELEKERDTLRHCQSECIESHFDGIKLTCEKKECPYNAIFTGERK